MESNPLDQVSGLTFLHRKHQDRHIQVSWCLWCGGREYRGVVVYPSMWSSTPWSQDTVMDGEMVIDTVDGVSYPR